MARPANQNKKPTPPNAITPKIASKELITGCQSDTHSIVQSSLVFILVAGAGLEPTLAGSKPAVLPIERSSPCSFPYFQHFSDCVESDVSLGPPAQMHQCGGFPHTLHIMAASVGETSPMGSMCRKNPIACAMPRARCLQGSHTGIGVLLGQNIQSVATASQLFVPHSAIAISASISVALEPEPSISPTIS